MKINLVITTFFEWCLLCEKPLLWGALLSQLLPSLILVLQPYFIEFLCIAKRYLPILCSKFFAVLNIFKLVIWSREFTLCNVFLPSFPAVKLYHTFFTTIWSEVLFIESFIGSCRFLKCSPTYTWPVISRLYSCSDINHVPYLWT